MKQDSRGLVLQAQGLQYLGERVVTTAAEAVILSNDFTLAVNLATPGPLTIPLPPVADLPAEPGSVRLRIRDAANNAATHNITISATGTTINGGATYVIATNGGNLDFEWTGSATTGWVSYAQPPGTGSVGSVAVTAPIVNLGTALNPNISITPATALAAGSMSAADKTKLDALPSAIAPNPFFGNGFDGAVVLDGVATFAWASLAGSTYTLTRDVFPTTLTINSGITLRCNSSSGVNAINYGIVGRVSITNNGTITSAGSAAVGSAAGSSASSLTASVGPILRGNGGGAGAVTAANGTAGQNTSPSMGGAGGAGGTAGAFTGGAGGTVTSPTLASAALLYANAIVNRATLSAGNFPVGLRGGSGGGGGACDGVNAAGGGGGEGGHPMYLAAPTIVNGGVISAKGGTGAAGATAGLGTGNAGGGAGGGGGAVFIYAASYSGTAPDVSGGAGGAGFNTGAAGASGAAGVVVYMTNTQ